MWIEGWMETDDDKWTHDGGRGWRDGWRMRKAGSGGHRMSEWMCGQRDGRGRRNGCISGGHRIGAGEQEVEKWVSCRD